MFDTILHNTAIVCRKCMKRVDMECSTYAGTIVYCMYVREGEGGRERERERERERDV